MYASLLCMLTRLLMRKHHQCYYSVDSKYLSDSELLAVLLVQRENGGDQLWLLIGQLTRIYDITDLSDS